jgi:hypothetical protein
MGGARRFQFRLKTLLWAMFGCAVVLSITTFGYRKYRNTIGSVQDFYAISQVTDMLIYHIKHHQGKPPRIWQDLEGAYEYVNSGYNNFSLGELRQRVDIDFDALAAGLNTLAANADQARIVSVKNRSHSGVAEAEANERLRAALGRTAGLSNKGDEVER